MLSRRVFLKNGAFALVSLGFAPSFLARTAVAAAPARAKQLIAIFQRGAVDGLSVVVPYGERDYYRARPTIAIARPDGGDGAALDLDGFFGFNPRLRRSSRSGIARELAIVHACGSPDSTRSHFDAQDYMESGDARREEHGRRLAEPLPAGAARRARDAVPRRRADAAAAAHAAGLGAGARDQPARAVRHPRRPGERGGRRVVRSASTPRPPTRC